MSAHKFNNSIDEKGATAHEAALGIFIIVVFITLIIAYVKPASFANKVKNLSIKTAVSRAVGDINSYRVSYDGIPNGWAFYKSLSEEVLQFEKSCEFFGDPTYKCLFKPKFVSMPSTCDITRWETDKIGLGNFECFMYYSASTDIRENEKRKPPEKYRIYAKSWGKDESYIVYDSTGHGKYYLCPSNFRDKDDLKFCREWEL